MNPIAALLGRLPSGGATHPVAPPLPPDAVARMLAEVGADRGLSHHLLGPISRALGSRLESEGLAADFDEPWAAALRHLPGREGDVFAGRSVERQDLNPAERTLRTAAWARAAAEVIEEAAADHPSLRTVRFDDRGASRLEPFGDGPLSAAIVVMKGVWTLERPAGRDVAELASEIGTALASGQFRRIETAGPQQAPIAILSDRRTLQHARHGHRANGLQGPWGCLATASRSAHGPPMELMGGWSLAADHELLTTLTARIFKRIDELLQPLPESTFQWLGRAMTRAYIDSWRSPESSLHRQPDGLREEFYSEQVPADVDLARLTWATGRAVRDFLGSTDTVGVPLRVEYGDRPHAVLSAVHFDRGEPESAETFTARLRDQRRRESDGRGLLVDSLRRTVGQGAPAGDRARMLCRARSRGPFAGPYAWLAGVVRVRRLSTDENTPWALHAGGSSPFAPGLAAVPGGLSVTLLAGPDRTEIGLMGTGPFGERGALERLGAGIIALL